MNNPHEKSCCVYRQGETTLALCGCICHIAQPQNPEDRNMNRVMENLEKTSHTVFTPESSNKPTSADLISPEFNAVWKAIKKWDIKREEGLGYAHATGTDVMIILSALEMLNKKEEINDDILLAHEEAGRLYRENKGIK